MPTAALECAGHHSPTSTTAERHPDAISPRSAEPPDTPRRHPTTLVPVAPGGAGESTSHVLATRMSKAILDVLTGRRKPASIRHQVSGAVALLLTSTPHWKGEGPSYRLRSVHTCLATARAVEACAVVETSHRARALALRLERADSHWSCTLLVEL